MGSLRFPGWEGETRLIHQDPQWGGHNPQLMASVQASGSKDIPVVSLLMALLGAEWVTTPWILGVGEGLSRACSVL